MEDQYEDWWLKEVKDHYQLFKLAISAMLAIAACSCIISYTIFSVQGIQGVSTTLLFLFLIGVTGIVSLVWYLDHHFSKVSIMVALFSIEFMSTIYILRAFSTLQDHKMMICILTTSSALLIQMGFIKNTKLALLIPVKNLFMWYTLHIINGDIHPHFPLTYMGHAGAILHALIYEALRRK